MTFGREREDGPAIGRISETAVIKRLLELGFEVLLPYSSTAVYDLAYFSPPRKKLFGGMAGNDYARAGKNGASYREWEIPHLPHVTQYPYEWQAK